MRQPAEDRSRSHAEADLEWCYETVQGVSRTFAITVDVLKEPMSSYICVGYLLCRVPDTIEDAGHVPADRQVELLETYESVLDPAVNASVEEFLAEVEPWVPDADGRSDDWELVAETQRVLRAFESLPDGVQRAARGPARELVSGMATFVDRYEDDGGLRLRTREELLEYSHYAAGTVGELITNLVCRERADERPCPTLYETAESFGRLLQLVNIAKDVHDDYHEEDNVYLPADRLRAEGVEPDAVVDPDNAEGVARVVRWTAGQARSLLDDAQRYLELVPRRDGNTVAAWAIPYLLAVGTLRELQDRPGDALTPGGVKVSRQEVHAVVERALAGLDKEDLSELRATIDEQPFHEA
ncbi:MAG: phytoene/squalene synthase family protein [Halobacteriales archaeon]